ncbi:N-acetylmuramoyl-L-alanine amidase [Amphibacillus sediminis]|uniref:N-acetylmuramoyl-L-alanine amidase n=1 Tax=Amphibacillus sediminis TaxID=360185 RepID=UPI000831E077|nr:N-acetylmuramoyl-L-alanine amidase [Amphibacillus sediminis]
MVKLFIDPGHGGSDPGAVANGLQEKNLTLSIAIALRDYLTSHYQDISIRMSRTSDQSIALSERTRMANQWGADFYLSIHINAGGGVGFESYIWNRQFTNKSRTQQLRSTIHQAIIRQTDWRDRGQKEANFHVLRETTMPAILTENGFIDHQEEARSMRKSNWIDQVAEAHAIGIAEAFHLKTNTAPPTQNGQTLYRVVAGSFIHERNAREQINALQNKGYDSYVLPYREQNQTYFRVVAGAFNQRSNAENRLKALKNDGFDGFIVVV